MSDDERSPNGTADANAKRVPFVIIGDSVTDEGDRAVRHLDPRPLSDVLLVETGWPLDW